MPQFFDLETWSEQSWWNTGGTRDKKIYLSPVGELYYFKQSFKKGKRDYKYEFWSEIIASEIGNICSFDILSYHLAVRDGEVGCLSKSMILQNEELVEGGKYIQAFDTTFNPSDVKLRDKYDFDLIIEALDFFKLQVYYPKIIETIVFDALIGNSDRHQENWALINTHSTISKSMTELEREIEPDSLKNYSNFFKWFIELIYYAKGQIRPEFRQIKLLSPNKSKFAPIYDSGCSFGRELDDEKVSQMVLDQRQIENYVNKGLSEIHWDNKKISHFDLIDNLLKDEDFKELTKQSIRKVIDNYNSSKIKELIDTIDVDLPEEYGNYKLPKERKELIVKIVDLRFKKLKNLL